MHSTEDRPPDRVAEPVLFSSSAPAAPPVLETRDLSYHVDGLAILERVSIVVPGGQIVAIVGPNGAGKTTLFELISGHSRPTSGSIRMGGEEVVGLRSAEVASRGVGRLFQEVRVFARLSVLENVLVALRRPAGESAFGAIFDWRWRKQRAAAVEVAWDHLRTVGLEHEARRWAMQLSFGQQKLLGFASLLASEAQLLLLDEPTAGLAPAAIERVLGLIDKLVQHGGRTILLIEHDLDSVTKLCDRAYVLERGQILAEGAAEDVVSDLQMRAARFETLVEVHPDLPSEEEPCSR